MHACIYVCMYVCMSVCMCEPASMYTQIHTYVCVMYVCVHVCWSVHMCECKCVCACIRACVCALLSSYLNMYPRSTETCSLEHHFLYLCEQLKNKSITAQATDKYT